MQYKVRMKSKTCKQGGGRDVATFIVGSILNCYSQYYTEVLLTMLPPYFTYFKHTEINTDVELHQYLVSTEIPTVLHCQPFLSLD